MATMRYFSDLNGSTVELAADVVPMRNADFAARFPGVKGRRYDSFTMRVGYVEGSKDLLPITRSIEFKRNPSLHKCDARCLHAKGHLCECSCGGKNHGAGV